MKTKRIKKVFSSSQEVFHLWANQSQTYAKQGGKITRAYFEENKCYSYGSHYEVGRLVTINGKTVALINNTGYSHTTSKHIREAITASNHFPQVFVDGSFDWKKGLLEMQQNLIVDLFDTFNKRSFHTGYCVWDGYDRAKFTAFNSLCDTLEKPHLKIWPDDDLIDLLEDHVKSCLDREKELQLLKNTLEYLAKKQAEKDKKVLKEKEKHAAEIEAWKLGGPFTHWVNISNPQLIRILGDKVQTSNHAEVPLSDALELLRKIQSRSVQKGDKIGSYTFDEIQENIVKIGCHKISLIEAKAVLIQSRHLKLA